VDFTEVILPPQFDSIGGEAVLDHGTRSLFASPPCIVNETDLNSQTPMIEIASHSSLTISSGKIRRSSVPS